MKALEFINKARYFDGIVLFTLLSLIFWGSWGEVESLKWLVGLGYFSCYFFETEKNKTAAKIMTGMLWAFLLTGSLNPKTFPISVFIVLNVLFVSWFFYRINKVNEIKWTLIGLTASSFILGVVIDLQLFAVHESLWLFAALALGLSWVPFLLALGMQKNLFSIRIFQALVLHQVLVRVGVIYWGLVFHDQIMALELFKQFNLPLIGAMYFLPFFALLNQNKVKWPFLYESFISLLIFYVVLSGRVESMIVAVGLVSLGTTNSLFHMAKKVELWSSQWLCSLERGGFGGIYFFITIAMLFKTHDKTTFLPFVLLLILVFLFSVTAHYIKLEENKNTEQVTLRKREVNGRLIYQIMGFAFFVWIIQF